jgi:ketosteroid isomerase-like protein
MKLSLIFISACALFIACKPTQKPIDAALLTEDEARQFLAAYDSAWSSRDTTSMKEIMSEKYIYFSSTGSTISRDRIISWFNPADKYKVDTAIRSEIAVTIDGNTAVVSSRWVGSGTFDKQPFRDNQRCGLVLQKLNGRVRIISEHCVQIVP